MRGVSAASGTAAETYGQACAGPVALALTRALHPWSGCLAPPGQGRSQDGQAADAALGRAEAALDAPGAQDAPPWPWLFPFDHAKLAGYRALACVRLGRAGQALAAFAQSLARHSPRRSSARCSCWKWPPPPASKPPQPGTPPGSMRRSGWPPKALAAGQRYGSERVIERSRQFRRAYTGPVTGRVRDFDRQLAALLS